MTILQLFFSIAAIFVLWLCDISQFNLLLYFQQRRNMSSIVFHNQNILNKGQNPGFIFKIIRGSASILDSNSKTILTLKSPAYLNLPQIIYDSHSIKTIKAEGRCQVSKVRLKQSHKQVIGSMKENGLRKNHFHIFQDVPSVYFYSLMQYSKIQTVEKGIFMQTTKDNIYLIVQGNIYVSMNRQLKLIKLNIGEILVALDDGISLYSQNYHMKIAYVNISLAKTLLGDFYSKIEVIGKQQLQILKSYCIRNQRLSVTLNKSRKQFHAKVDSNVPKEFINKIEAKVEKFEQYRRARSCFSGSKLLPQQIIRQNQKKYHLIMDFNRKKYCRNQKSMNLGQQSYLSPHSKSYSLNTTCFASIFQNNSLKSQLLKENQSMLRFYQSKKTIKRKGRRIFVNKKQISTKEQ